MVEVSRMSLGPILHIKDWNKNANDEVHVVFKQGMQNAVLDAPKLLVPHAPHSVKRLLCMAKLEVKHQLE